MPRDFSEQQAGPQGAVAARFPPSEALPLHFEVRAEGKEEEEEGKGL